MTQHSNHKSIEAQIERERASLSSTLNALQDRVSVEALARDAMDSLRANAESYTRSAEAMIRANPMALALTGVGIAWLIFGSKDRGATPAPKREAVSRWEDEGGQVAPVAAASEDWFKEASAHRDRATSAMAKIERKAHEMADDAADRAEVAKTFAAGLVESFRHGLDDLTDSAKDRIVALREQAYAAWLDAEKQSKKLSKTTGHLIEDNPVLSAAILGALGAGLAAALPRTETENRNFGAQSDRLMKEARDMLMQERDRMMRVAKGVVDEVQSSAHDVVAAAKETPARIKERAEAEAAAKT